MGQPFNPSFSILSYCRKGTKSPRLYLFFGISQAVEVSRWCLCLYLKAHIFDVEKFEFSVSAEKLKLAFIIGLEF